MTPREAAAALGETIALAEGFTLHFVLSPSPAEAQALLAELEQSDDPRSLELVDPYGAWGTRVTRPDEPLTIDDLETEMRRLLLRLEALRIEAVRAVVIDASCFHPRDLAAWRFAFARLNEIRNGAMLRLPTNVVLVLDTALARDAILTAPDLWSVRTNQISLTGGLRGVDPSGWLHEAGAELLAARLTLRSAAMSTLPDFGSIRTNRTIELSSVRSEAFEGWVPAEEAQVLANRDLVEGLGRIRPFPTNSLANGIMEPEWRLAARALFGVLPRACRSLDWEPIRPILAAFSSSLPSTAVRCAVYLLAAYEAFAKGAFEEAAEWFASGTPTEPEAEAVEALVLFPRLGQCLSTAALGRLEEARRLFFELEASAASGESAPIERLVTRRSAELYGIFGDVRRARLAASVAQSDSP